MRTLGAAPFDNSEKYKKFTDPFILVSMAVGLTCPYLLLFFLETRLEDVAIWLSSEFSIFKPRIEFLKSIDNFSHLAFSATVLSNALVMQLMMLTHGFFYWKTVVVPRKCKPISRETVFVMLAGTLFFCAFVYIAFVDVPEYFNSDRPGKALYMFWPFFPVFGTIVTVISVFSISVSILAILKLVFIRGEPNSVN